MHIRDIELQIRELILELYGKQYIGKLEIEPLDTKGYCVTFRMQDTNLPITICAELEDEEFFKYLKQELKDMQLHRVTYSTLWVNDKPIYIDIPCRKKN